MLYLSMLMHRLAEKAKEDKGAAMAEYGLLVALIALVVLAGVQLLGTNLLATFNQIAGKFPVN